MKTLSKIAVLLMLAVALSAGSAMAGSYTTMDNTIAWTGYENPAYPNDEYGVPKLSSLTVNTNALGDLTSVMVQMHYSSRPLPDSLFINTSHDGNRGYEGWDFYVKTFGYGNNVNPNPKLYTVGSYDYEYATLGRIGHPSGIDTSTVQEDTNGLLGLVVWDENTQTLTYNFNAGINVGNSFVIGYTLYCANDVILTPEPSTMLLLGFGLLGVGLVGRRKSA